MVAVPTSKSGAFAKALPNNIRAILIYGPDRGLVSERAGAITKAFVGKDGDGLSITRITSGDLEEDISRLADEATALGLFGGKRVVRVRPERLQITSIVEDLFGRLADDLLLVVEAGQLAKSAALRKLFESSPLGAALPCYPDEGRDLAAVIEDHFNKAGQTIDADARAVLVEQLGGDRIATRAELEKLSLYCLGKTGITLKDVEAVSGEAALLSLDDLADAMGLGRLRDADRLLQRQYASGFSPDGVVAVVSRHIMLLHELRGRVETGKRPDDAVAAHKPPIFFKRKSAITNQCRIWSLANLNRALEIAGDAERQLRRGNGLAHEIAANAVLTICAKAASISARA